MFPPAYYPQMDINALRRKTLFDNYGMPNPDEQPPVSPQQQMGQNPIPQMGSDPNFMGPLQEPEVDAGFIGRDVDRAANTIPSRPINDGTEPTMDLRRMMDELYTPSTVDRDRFRGLLDNAPQRQEPGLLRTIVASGIGVGPRSIDPKLQEDVMYAPHNRAMSDWKDKAQPFYQGASLENTANTQERTLASGIVTNEVNNRRWEQANETARLRAEEIERNNRDRARITEEKNESDATIREKKNEIEALWRLGYKFVRNGNRLIATRPDGSTYVADENTAFSPLELEKYRQDGRMALQRLENQGAVATKEAIPGYNPANPGGRRAGTTPEAEFEAQRKKVLVKALDDPDTAEFVEAPATVNGHWKLIPPKKPFGFWSEVDPAKKAKYDKLRAQIDAIEGGGTAYTDDNADTTPPPDAFDQSMETSFPTEPAPPKLTREQQLQQDLKNPKLDPRGRASLENQLRGITDTRATDTKKEAEINEILKNPNVRGSQRQQLEAQLQGIKDRKAVNTPAPPSKAYRTYTDADNPQNKRRTADGGNTYEYSYDGGQTWGEQ